ncbi:MAG: TonB-dependent receptor [Parasphingorhabdus sp.]
MYKCTWKLLATTALVVGPFAATAHAQEVEEGASDDNLIIVTATKRPQTLQEVPMSVSVTSAEEIDNYGLTDLLDLSSSVPNLTISNNNGGDRFITLRGMGSPDGQRATEQSVSLYSDGVYNPRSKQYASAFFDVDRVEILRGPQAILFGINSTAGAINIVSKSNEGGDAFEASITGDLDLEYGGGTITGTVGGGLSDTLGARLAVRYQDTDGFLQGVTADGAQKDFQARLSVDWDLTDSFSVQAKASVFDLEYNGQPFEGTTNINEDPDLVFPFDASLPSAALFGVQQGSATDGFSVNLQADYEFNGFILSALYGHNEFDSATAADFDGGSEADGALLGPVGTEAFSFESIGSEEFNQDMVELRLTSPSDQPLEYIVGVNYLSANLSSAAGVAIDSPTFRAILSGIPIGFNPANPLLSFSPASFDNPFGWIVADIDQELWSAYATATYELTDNFRVSAGIRYTDEKKEASRFVECGRTSSGIDGMVRDDSPGRTGSCLEFNTADIALGGPGALYGAQGSSGSADIDFERWLPEVALQWDVSDEHTLFARYAKSAKSGGIASAFASTSVTDALFGPESVDGFEIGSKSLLLDNRLALNVTLFYNEYKDLQVTSFTFGSVRVDNAGSATVQGLEADARFAATDWLTVGGAISVLDAEYDSYQNGSCAQVDATSPSVENGDGSCDLSGLSLQNAPNVSGNVYFSVDAPVTESISALLGAQLNFSGSYFTDAKAITPFRQESYSILNAYVGIAHVDNAWSLKLVGNNLTNKLLTGSGIEINALGLGNVLPVANRPRSVNLVATVNF